MIHILNHFLFLRLDATLGFLPPSRENTLVSRSSHNVSTSKGRFKRSSSQSRTGQITVLEHLQVFNDRLTTVEQQMISMTTLLERIDDRMSQFIKI